MARRKFTDNLTIQQRGRANIAQQRRMNRQIAGRSPGLAQVGGELGPEEEGVVIAHFGLNVEVEAGDGTSFRCAVRETLLDAPVCGDRVVWQRAEANRGVVVAVYPRRSVLRRPAAMGRMQTVAANVDQLLVTTISLRLNPGLLDRYLVAAEAAGITPVILVNKMDLMTDKEDRQFLKEELAVYRDMGYEVLRMSAVTGKGVDKLEAMLVNRISVFVGHSGVGKSALIGRWVSSPFLKIAEFCDDNGRGRHTTTVARLYRLPSGGSVIDSPGVRSFGLAGLEPGQIPACFRDIRPFLGQCRFSNCTHTVEPDCRVLAAVDKGKIDSRRLESMFRIMESMQEEG